MKCQLVVSVFEKKALLPVIMFEITPTKERRALA